MDYFLEFHWWYVLLGLVVFVLLFGKSKGGVVVKRYSAYLEVLDERFTGCTQEAKYLVFKPGKPEKIEIEVEKLPLDVGEMLEFQINGKHLANVLVEKDKEAEFEHYSDEGVSFPKIKAGDEVTIKYQGKNIIQGEFQEA